MKKSSRKKKIRKVYDDAMTICRKKTKNGIRYVDENGKKVKSKKLLARFEKLVIPPMWTNVQICKWPDGHIQAIGRDLKGRKQYIYHSVWEERRQAKKFAKLKKFGSKLADFRKLLYKNVDSRKWTKKKILSLIILILDETGIRIGNQQYAKKNDTYGLTTLRRKHMTVDSDRIVFEYTGKSNKTRKVEIEDNKLHSLIKKTADFPGYEIFRYQVKSKKYKSIDSDDVNAYIKKHMGTGHSSKDFRTWVASRLAIELYPLAEEEIKVSSRKKLSNILIRMVAEELGNTPEVCKSYYVHPKIMQKIEDKKLKVKANSSIKKNWKLNQYEKLLLKII